MLFIGLVASGASSALPSGSAVSLTQAPLVMRVDKDEFRIVFGIDGQACGQNGGSGSGAQPSAAQLVIPDAEAPIIQATQIYSRAGLGSGVDIRV